MSIDSFLPFIYPKSYTIQAHSPPENPVVYLERNKNNILSEHWALVRQNGSAPAVFKVSVRQNGKSQYIFNAEKANTCDDKDVDLLELHLNFGVLDGYYCLLQYDYKDEDLNVWKGQKSTKSFRGDSTKKPNFSNFYNYGYIGDSISEYNACLKLLTLSNFSALLTAAADPTKRRPVRFLTPTREEIDLGQAIPINDGQFAILSSLSYSIEGIQGPPGTGKSTSIVLLARHFIPIDEIILATCVQNKAVDSIAEKLGSLSVGDLPFFVLGNPDRLGIEAKRWTLESQISRDIRVVPLFKSLGICIKREQLANDCLKSMEAEKSATDLMSKLLKSLELDQLAINALKLDTEKSDVETVQELYSQLFSLSYTASLEYRKMCAIVRVEILSKARVVLCTVATASSSGPYSFSASEELRPLFEKLTTIIMDEAGTAPEPKLPLLLTLNLVLTLNYIVGITRIIMIGDQQQLAPFSLVQGHHMGCFQRLDMALPQGSIGTLTEQYRMHPMVSEFISVNFYDGKLKTPAAVFDARMFSDPIGLYWLAYADNNAESTPPFSKSKQNETEAELVVQAVKREVGCKRSVMVITFYKSQETLIRKYFKDHGILETSNCRVTTVDQSQGSESDVIILSGVRCNLGNKIGFVDNLNRINVSISRMKKRLVVIGSAETLTTNPKWMELYKTSTLVKTVNDIPPLNLSIDDICVAMAHMSLESAAIVIDGDETLTTSVKWKELGKTSTLVKTVSDISPLNDIPALDSSIDDIIMAMAQLSLEPAAKSEPATHATQKSAAENCQI